MKDCFLLKLLLLKFLEEVLYYKNWNIDNIVTPINVEILEYLLINTKYNEEETKFITRGFSEGFDVGYHGRLDRQDLAPNIPLKSGMKTDL